MSVRPHPQPAESGSPFVSGLVLGAGGSSRLGRPKQLLPYGGGDGTLLGHVVGVARECRFDQTIVAIGGAADEVRRRVDLAGVEVVVNQAYGEGCSSSIAAALASLDPRCRVLVLMLGDQPGVGPGPSPRCSRAAARRSWPSAGTRTGGAIRSPSRAEVFPALADLHGDKGVWRLLDQRADQVHRGADRRPDPARHRHPRGLPRDPRAAGQT